RRRGVTLTIIPITGVPEVRAGDELATLVADAAAAQGTPLTDGDCLVVTQKVVSKAEDRLVALDGDDRAARRAPIRAESVRGLRRRGGAGAERAGAGAGPPPAGRPRDQRAPPRVRVRERGRRRLERGGRAGRAPAGGRRPLGPTRARRGARPRGRRRGGRGVR